MPVELREIASIAGMPGLYRIVSPTRSGVIIETLADNPARSVAQAKHRISLLHEISVYTNDPEVTVPLSDIFDRIRTKFGNDLPVDNKSDSPALSSFMEEVLPDYDRDRVYMSDIKKIAAWYGIVSKHLTFDEAPATEEKTADKAETEAKPAKKTKPKAEKSEKTTEKPEAEKKAEAKPKKTKKSAE
ncbi:MAG TPA: DUF5606 domain-containing protein [Adhaeribacter sp.]|nr:DUF5606 domain-containing protein [Adhaeribacter sp.]